MYATSDDICKISVSFYVKFVSKGTSNYLNGNKRAPPSKFKAQDQTLQVFKFLSFKPVTL